MHLEPKKDVRNGYMLEMNLKFAKIDFSLFRMYLVKKRYLYVKLLQAHQLVVGCRGFPDAGAERSA